MVGGQPLEQRQTAVGFDDFGIGQPRQPGPALGRKGGALDHKLPHPPVVEVVDVGVAVVVVAPDGEENSLAGVANGLPGIGEPVRPQLLSG